MRFSGIHDSHYIGINSFELLDDQGRNVSFTITMVDEKPENRPKWWDGWWAACGEEHTMVLALE